MNLNVKKGVYFLEEIGRKLPTQIIQKLFSRFLLLRVKILVVFPLPLDSLLTLFLKQNIDIGKIWIKFHFRTLFYALSSPCIS